MRMLTRVCVREHAERFVACVFVCFCAGGVHGQDRAAQAVADQIFEMSQTRSGVFVHYGCGEGRLTAALARTESCIVEGLSPDADQVARTRTRMQDVRFSRRRRSTHVRGGVQNVPGQRRTRIRRERHPNGEVLDGRTIGRGSEGIRCRIAHPIQSR